MEVEKVVKKVEKNILTKNLNAKIARSKVDSSCPTGFYPNFEVNKAEKGFKSLNLIDINRLRFSRYKKL